MQNRLDTVLLILLAAGCTYEPQFENPVDPESEQYVLPAPELAAVPRGEHLIRLSWSGSPYAGHFRIERKTEASYPYVLIGQVPLGGTSFDDSSTFYSDSVYTYRIAAVLESRVAYSNESATRVIIQPPRVWQLKELGKTSVNVKWIPDSQCISFDSELSSDGGITFIQLPSVLTPEITVTGLIHGVDHMLRIRGVTNFNKSDWTSEAILSIDSLTMYGGIKHTPEVTTLRMMPDNRSALITFSGYTLANGGGFNHFTTIHDIFEEKEIYSNTSFSEWKIYEDRKWNYGYASVNHSGTSVAYTGGALVIRRCSNWSEVAQVQNIQGSVDFSSDDAFVANVNVKNVEIRSAATLELVRTWRPHEGFPAKVLFSPTARILATFGQGSGGSHELRLWDFADSSLIGDIQGLSARIDLSFTPDGSKLVLKDGIRLAILDPASGSVVTEYNLPDFPLSSTLDATGTVLIVTHYYGPVTHHQLSNGTLLKTMTQAIDTPLFIATADSLENYVIGRGTDLVFYSVTHWRLSPRKIIDES